MIGANKYLKLTPKQKITAEQCELILENISKIGIYTLIDIVTKNLLSKKSTDSPTKKKLNKALTVIFKTTNKGK
jgi:hypothetical protein